MPILTSIATRSRLSARVECRVELREILDAVDADYRIGAIGKLHQPIDLDVPNDLVGDQDIPHACGGHHFGFSKFGAGNADRAGGDLHLCNVRCLVCFRVRPPGDTVGAARGDDPSDIGFHDVEIDKQRRSIQRELRLTDQTGRRRRAGVHRILS